MDWLNFNCKSGDLKTRISGIQHKTHHTWKHHQPSEILDVWQLFNTKRLTPMMLHHVFFYYLVDLSTFIPTLRMVYYIWFSHIFNMYQMVSSLKFQGPAFQQPINKCFFLNIMIKLCFFLPRNYSLMTSTLGDYSFLKWWDVFPIIPNRGWVLQSLRVVCWNSPSPAKDEFFLNYQRLLRCHSQLSQPMSTPEVSHQLNGHSRNPNWSYRFHI